MIERAVFEKLFGEHVDPRTGERLGRAAQQFKTEADIFAELAGAEPHATGARLAELRAQARASVRHAVPFWDITASMSKSVSLLYGARLAAAERARRAGDHAEARRHDRDAGKVWAAIMKGNAGGAGLPPARGGDDPHRLPPRQQGRDAGRAGQVGARPELGHRVVPAAHQPGG